jgi:ribosomal protein S18 acetylase RimI-like enzyme
VINTLVRLADSKDHQQISNLIFFETRLHRHLDWRSPLDWLGNPFYWALDEGKRISAAMACPIEAERIAWIRLFVYSGGWSAENAWNLLWSAAKEDVSHAGGATVAAIAMQPWFQTVLAENGFENRQRIVMLEWRYQPWAGSEAHGVRIRTMTDADLSEVETLDAASFHPLWHNPLETLRRAFKQSLFATVAEKDGRVIGYQFTTGTRGHAHLARLAIHPTVQKQNIGTGMLSDLFMKLTQSGIVKLSVNTQDDNLVSLGLYQKLGFVRTGEQYPVFTYDVPAYV